MLEGIGRYDRIIVGAYTDRTGGVCPMLAAHRCGGRTDFRSFARAWDRFTGAGRRARSATERELRTLTAQLEASVWAEDDLRVQTLRTGTPAPAAPRAAAARRVAGPVPALGRLPRRRAERRRPRAEREPAPDREPTARPSRPPRASRLRAASTFPPSPRPALRRACAAGLSTSPT